MNRLGWLLVAVVIAAGGWWLLGDRKGPAANAGATIVDVTVPELSGDALAGQAIFAVSCAGCHGETAGGIEGSGPPLVHRIYEPSHHGDMAFVMAARMGVRAHHWRFGNMPPVEGVSDADVQKVVAYVRALQRANGIR